MLGGTTPLTIEQPYSADCGKIRVPVLKMPIPLMAFQEGRGDIWDKYVAKSLDMRHGVRVAVGTNNDAVLPDLAYIIVQQGPEPTTFAVVLHGPAAMRSRQAAASAFSGSTGRSRPVARALVCRRPPERELAALARGSGREATLRPALPPGCRAAERTRIENVLAHATISTRVEIEPFPCASTCSTTC